MEEYGVDEEQGKFAIGPSLSSFDIEITSFPSPTAFT
jgi:hypothetical protein